MALSMVLKISNQLTGFPPYSGIARFAAGRRVGAAIPRTTARNVLPSAFIPFRFNAARFASTEAQRKGKIHQVIGAVVDGMYSQTLMWEIAQIFYLIGPEE